jgi:hypothetical protein
LKGVDATGGMTAGLCDYAMKVGNEWFQIHFKPSCS